MNIIAVLIISTINFLEPASGHGQLEIVFKDCRTGQLFYNEKICLKDEEGKEIDFLVNHKKNKLKRLKPGTYKIEFESIFGRREVEEHFEHC